MTSNVAHAAAILVLGAACLPALVADTVAAPALERPPQGVPLPVDATPGQQFTDIKLSWAVDAKWGEKGTAAFNGRAVGAPGSGGYLYAVTAPFGTIRCAPILARIKGDNGQGHLAQHGITHLEESGTGGGAQYGNMRVYLLPDDGSIPTPDKVRLPLVSHHGNGGSEMVSEYKAPSVRWSSTAGHAAAIHRLEPLKKGERFGFALDLAKVWGSEPGKLSKGEEQQFLGGSYKWISDTEVDVVQRTMGGWGSGKPWTLYARVKLSRTPLSIGGWSADSKLTPNLRQVDDTKKVTAKQSNPNARWEPLATADAVGFLAVYDQPVDVTVALSFTSHKRASEILARDAADGYEAVRDRTEKAWRASLARVLIEGGDRDQREIFYSQMRACLLLPSDRTGDNPLWNGSAPFYDDFFTMWDTYHCLKPLYTFLLPRRAGHLACALTDMAENEGFFFDARMANNPGYSQAGCMGELVACEAALKELPFVDPARTLKAAVRSATTPSPASRFYGRWDVETYWSKGYVQSRFGGGSRTIEYSRTDWAIAQLARKLGDNATYEKFSKAAGNWENLWHPDWTDGYFKGFIWGKDEAGNFVTERFGKPFPFFKGAGIGNSMFCENQSNVYTLNVLHDADRLVKLIGGEENLTKRIWAISTRATPDQYAAMFADPDLEKRLGVFIPNEPNFDPPWMFHMIGRPDRTMELLRKLPLGGGDDAGAGNAYRVWVALGFYPFAGTDIYFVVAPRFPRTLVQRDDGTTLEILAPGATGIAHKPGCKAFVESVRVDGKPLHRAWLSHREVMNARKIDFVLSENPTQWGIGNLPPCRGRPNVSD